VAMFLPWYQQNAVVNVPRAAPLQSRNLNAFQVFSFVEAAVLLVALAVLYLLFARGERRSFKLPGGDGTVVLAAGIWVALLLVLRLFDKPGISTHGIAGNVGIQWGIFFALAASGLLALAGSRMRAGARPEPPLERRAARTRPDHPTEHDTEITEVRRAHPRRPEEPQQHPPSRAPTNPLHAPPVRSAPREAQPSEQLSLEDEAPYSPPSGE
jgi:hypothetical protein